MRIVSLVPHATELLFALGLGDDVVAVTHECDFPLEVLELPHVTRDVLPAGLAAAEIDAAVRERTQQGKAIYELDEDRLAELEPDLIVTQELCAVCAVSYDDVVKVAEELATVAAGHLARPEDPRRGDGRHPHDRPGDRRRATPRSTSSRASARGSTPCAGRVKGAEPVSVAAIEWLDPVFVAGHWTPQIIELAGGADVLGFAGEHSEQSTWEIVAAARPEVVVVMPCGYDAERSREEALAYAASCAAIGAKRVVAVDAAAYFSRPGPRLVDGLELMAHVLHPDLVPEAPGAVYEIDV